MTMQQQVDVLIIGLGPAGASAAGVLAKAGYRVLGVEKNKVLGQPVQCAEFIPLPMQRYAQPNAIFQQAIAGMKTYLPSGSCHSSVFPGLMIDRARLDQNLAETAQEHGAKFYLDASLSALDVVEQVARITMPQGESHIKYRYLIAADGPNSKVARCLGLSPLQTVNTRQYLVPLLEKYEDTDIWISDRYPGGYAWLFPKGNFANLGLGADRRYTTDLKTPLDELHARLVEQGRVGPEIRGRTGGLIPVGGMRPQLVVKDCVFVGDAAGLTHPITGGGIPAAIISGEAAGQAIMQKIKGDEDALVEYHEDMEDQFGPTLARAIARREWLDHIWTTCEAENDAVMKRGWIAFDEYFEELGADRATVC